MGMAKQQAVGSVEDAAVPWQQVAGILDVYRALEGGFKEVAQLGEGIDRNAQQSKGEPAGLAVNFAVNGAKDHAANKAAHRAFRAFLGADAGATVCGAQSVCPQSRRVVSEMATAAMTKMSLVVER